MIKKANDIKVGDFIKGRMVEVVDKGRESKVTILHLDNGKILPLNKDAEVLVENSKVVDGKVIT